MASGISVVAAGTSARSISSPIDCVAGTVTMVTVLAEGEGEAGVVIEAKGEGWPRFRWLLDDSPQSSSSEPSVHSAVPSQWAAQTFSSFLQGLVPSGQATPSSKKHGGDSKVEECEAGRFKKRNAQARLAMRWTYFRRFVVGAFALNRVWQRHSNRT